MKATKLIQVNGKPLGNGALPIVITPLVGKTQAAILDEVTTILPKKPDLLEWRIDFFEAIGDSQIVIDTALAIREAAAGIPVLLTRRNETEGGQPLTIKLSGPVEVWFRDEAAEDGEAAPDGNGDGVAQEAGQDGVQGGAAA